MERILAAIERNDAAAVDAALVAMNEPEPGRLASEAHPYRPTLLHLACSMAASSKVIDVLLKHGAQAKADLDGRGWTACHVAAGTGNVEAMEALLAVDPSLHQATTGSGLTPLVPHPPCPKLAAARPLTAALQHLACREAKPECVRALLLKGADPNARAQNGNTPFHLSAGSHAKSASGEGVESVSHGSGAKAEGGAKKEGVRVVLRASSRVINLLIAAGCARPLARQAARAPRGGGARADALLPNERGEVPLHVALRDGSVEDVFDMLGAEPAALRCLSAQFATPVDAAAGAGRGDLLRPLLSHFASQGAGDGGPAALFFGLAGGPLGEEEAAALGLAGAGGDGCGAGPGSGLAALRLDWTTVERARRWAGAGGEAGPGGSSPSSADCAELLAGALRAAYGEGAPGAALQRRLREAVEAGEPVDTLRALLPPKHGPAAVDPDWLYEAGGRWEGLLHAAARLGRADVLAWLLEEVAGGRPGCITVDRRDRDACTPLALAARAGHAHCAALLVRAGARPDFPTAEGSTPVHEAAAAGHADVVRAIAEACAAPPSAGPAAAAASASTLLPTAAEEEVKRGVPWPLTVRARQQQLTPLMLAARSPALPTVRAALMACAEGDAREALCGARSGSGRTALHFAAEACGGPQRGAALAAVAELVAAGPGAADTEDFLGETPLAAAVRAGSLEAARALLAAGARGERGWHVAAGRGDEAMLELLHGQLAGRGGAWSVEAEDAAGTTALHHAALAGHAPAVALLCRLGAGAEARDRSRGLTALHLAAGEGHAAACEALLEAAGPRAGPLVALADSFGITARQFATVRGHADVVALLDRYAAAAPAPPASPAPAPEAASPGPALDVTTGPARLEPRGARRPARPAPEAPPPRPPRREEELGAGVGDGSDAPALEADYERPAPGAHAPVTPSSDAHASPGPAPAARAPAASLGALLAAHALRPAAAGSPAWGPIAPFAASPGASTAGPTPSARGGEEGEAAAASSVAPECGSAVSQRSDPGRRWRPNLAELAPAEIDVDPPATRSTSSWIADAYRSYQHLRDSARPAPLAIGDDDAETPAAYGAPRPGAWGPDPAASASSGAAGAAGAGAGAGPGWGGFEVKRTTRDGWRQGREAEAESAVAGPRGADPRGMTLVELVPGLSGAQCARPVEVYARTTEGRVEEDRTERSSAVAVQQLARVTLGPVTGAPLLVVHVAWQGREDRPLGFLELPVDADLAFAREAVRVEGLEGLERPPRGPSPAACAPSDFAAGIGPDPAPAGFRFAFHGAPVSRTQESRKLAVDCLVLAHGSLSLLLVPGPP